VDFTPSLFNALETLMPPPPGSYLGRAQRSFRSATTLSTEVLLSMQGFIVIVIMLFITQSLFIKVSTRKDLSFYSLALTKFWPAVPPRALKARRNGRLHSMTNCIIS